MADTNDIGSVKALLNDARERIKESEDRSKDAIDRLDERVKIRLDDHEKSVATLILEIGKWTPLLTNLQKADEHKKTLTIMLVTSFITNIAIAIVSIFVWFVKSGGLK
jgi:hypothetical protein